MNIVVCVHSFRLVLSIDTQSYIMCNPPQTDSQDMKREPPDQMGFPTLTKPRDFRIGTEQLCFNLTWGKTLVSCDFFPLHQSKISTRMLTGNHRNQSKFSHHPITHGRDLCRVTHFCRGGELVLWLASVVLGRGLDTPDGVLAGTRVEFRMQ